jgi:hypothetical protein
MSILHADQVDFLADSVAAYGIIFPGSDHPFLGTDPIALEKAKAAK